LGALKTARTYAPTKYKAMAIDDRIGFLQQKAPIMNIPVKISTT
jgi:hypothetical protein